MNQDPLQKKSTNWIRRRPLSTLTVVLAMGLIIVPLYERSLGNVFFEPLNYIDATTLIMIGILLLRGVVKLRFDTDLQAVAIALIGVLSFVFTFEAIFKLAFYTFPWRMPPAELREFVIQVGIALTALTGFAFGKFSVSTASWVFIILFIVGWIVWLLVGFPQLNNGENFFTPVINIHLTWDMIYNLNRAIKFALCLAFFFFYTNRTSQQVGTEMGSIAKPEEIKFVDKLPKTRSSKIMRRVLKARAQGLSEGGISTLEEAMRQALTPSETEAFANHLRPLVEARQGTRRSAVAYLWAVK